MTDDIIDSTSLMAALDALAQERVVWEEGTLKKSNEELYQLMAKSLGVHRQVAKSRQLRKNLNDQLVARKIHFNENASLATRVVRCVFGPCGKKAYTYAAAIESAVHNNIKPNDFPQWLTNNGGLDNVRRSGKDPITLKLRKLELIRSAEEYYVACPALFEIPEKLPALAPSDDSSTSFSVALVRGGDTSKPEIVYGSKNGSLLNSLLQEAGKQAEVKLKAAKTNAKQNVRAKNVAAVIANVAGAELGQ